MRFTTASRCLLTLLVLWAGVAMAQVAPTTIFQLDGNAAPTASYPSCVYGGPCDYWNLLNGAGNGSATGGLGLNSSAGHSLVRTFINGTAATDTFVGGGSKDPNPISQWSYAQHSAPDKDTLNAGYAAAYIQNGDFSIIFGADRLSPNGDANIGIWFFQNAVGPNGSGGFTGSHKDHDIFVISAFTNGGGTSGVAVYEWLSSCTASHYSTPTTAGQCADTNLAYLGSAAANTVCTSNSPFCAITNAATTASTWEGNIASPLFFEGGVDITYVLSQVGVTNLPCFSSFLAETRSSQSTSAVLKDFLAGGFPVCGLNITKSCSAAIATNGTSVTYTMGGVVTNTGIGTLYNVKAYDTITGGSALPAVNVVNNTQNSTNLGSSTLAAGETGTWTTSSNSSALTQSDTAIAKGATVSGGTLDVTSSNTASASCGTSAQATLTPTKSCTTSLVASGGDVHVLVNYSGSVCNNGKSQITNLALADYEHTSTSPTSAPTLSSTSIAPCQAFDNTGACTQQSCVTYTGSYVATTDAAVSGGTGPGRYLFDDLIVITGAQASLGTVNTVSSTDARCNSTPQTPIYGCAPTSCPICQGSGECTP